MYYVTSRLSILVRGCKDQNGVIGQLAHQTRVVTFGIRADLALGQGERAAVGKGYPWMESENSSRRGATAELNLTCTMLGFDLGYVRP